MVSRTGAEEAVLEVLHGIPDPEVPKSRAVWSWSGVPSLTVRSILSVGTDVPGSATSKLSEFRLPMSMATEPVSPLAKFWVSGPTPMSSLTIVTAMSERVTRWAGTTEAMFPVIVSALFNDSGVLQGIRIVTDPRADHQDHITPANPCTYPCSSRRVWITLTFPVAVSRASTRSVFAPELAT